MSRIFISRLNPVRFVWENRSKPGAYNRFNFDSLYQSELVEDWDQPAYYYQKWQTTDAIRLQFISDFSPIILKLVNCDEESVITLNMSPKQQDLNNPGFRIFEADMSLASVPEGNYYIQAILGEEGDSMKSEPLSIKTLHEETCYIEYKNSSRKYDMIFEKGFSTAIRLEGIIGKLKVATADQMWQNQSYNQTIINSDSYRIFPFHIGGTFGIPDWMLDKLRMIFGLDGVQIDGKYFTKAEPGQEFEENAVDNYPLRGFTYNLRESINRSSDIIDPDVNANKKIVVVSSIETKYFGDMTSGSSSNDVLLLKYE